MQKNRISFEEFKSLFRDDFESEEETAREYNTFLSIFEQLDRSNVPDLSALDKVVIFEKSWQDRPGRTFWNSLLFGFTKQPAVSFVLGIVLGCILTVVLTNGRIDLPQTVTKDQALTIDRIGNTKTYKGQVIDEIYAQFENPTIVLEEKEDSSPPRKVLHGTVDNGEIYVVWNL